MSLTYISNIYLHINPLTPNIAKKEHIHATPTTDVQIISSTRTSKSPVQLLEALVNGGWSEFNTLTVEKQPSNGTMTTLRLPRFETTCDVDLEHALTACGITRLREAKIPAEFRSDNTELEASIVIGQWAKIKIDEDGVKASATAQSAHIPEGASRPTEVTFNRPFVYILSERSTGAILIGGIINKL